MTSPVNSIDIDALERDLNVLRDEIRAGMTRADVDHLRKMIRWSHACTFSGYATAWLAPNPVSALLMGIGVYTRWLPVAHHILHKGYDDAPGIPPR